MLSSLSAPSSEPFQRTKLSFWQKLWRVDWPLFFLMLALACASVVVVYSATYSSESAEYRNAYQTQAISLGVGLAGFFILAFTDYRIWVKHAPFIFGGALLALALVLVVGQTVNGAKSWIRVAGFSLQPAEFSKLAFILFLVWVFLQFRNRGLFMFGGALLLAALPMGLILGQPDLGSASVFLPIVYATMFVAGVRKRWLLIPLLLGIALMVYVVWQVNHLEPNGNISILGKELKRYQTNRILTFFDPNRDPQGAGWTINQSLIAIGSGGVSGKGFLQGTTIVLGFLPRNIAYNDFIFPVICEQWGFVGGTTLIAALGLMLLGILRVSAGTTDNGGSYLATGVFAMLFMHIFINIGMTIKVVPITGIPLPFISYGGTFLIVCLAALGLVQSVWIHRRN